MKSSPATRAGKLSCELLQRDEIISAKRGLARLHIYKHLLIAKWSTKIKLLEAPSWEVRILFCLFCLFILFILFYFVCEFYFVLFFRAENRARI